jgi:chemotaxis protein MotB
MLAIASAVLVAACGPKPPPAAPKQDERVAQLEKELADAKAEAQKEKESADALRQGDAELKAKAEEAKALEAKLAEAVGKAGEVTTADGAVKLELVDQILFPTGEATLTDNGKEVLSKVGAALKDVDKQIWVQGHTDDQPIFYKKPVAKEPPKPVAKAPPAKGAKGAKVAKPPDPKEPPKTPEKHDMVLEFVTNWELSAARALTVVHYLQDESKLEPARLAAVAFGQYRPVSKNKAKNRRIEIVLYPRVAISPK